MIYLEKRVTEGVRVRDLDHRVLSGCHRLRPSPSPPSALGQRRAEEQIVVGVVAVAAEASFPSLAATLEIGLGF
jgi:hypothetical protein